VIDGEIVCLDARGRINFKSLLFRREWPYFYAFNLLAVDGEDLREWPLVQRKRRLRRLVPRRDSRLLYLDHVGRRGSNLLDVVCESRHGGHRREAGTRALLDAPVLLGQGDQPDTTRNRETAMRCSHLSCR
jgi:hypothetical protein